MKIIILGTNRAEINEIKKKDYDKHFFKERNQCYRIFPDGLTRMRIYKNGVEQESDEVIVFPENGIIPHQTRGLDYSEKALKGDIDLHKDAIHWGPFNRFKLWIDNGNSIYKAMSPYMALLIAVIIVVWAFISS